MSTIDQSKDGGQVRSLSVHRRRQKLYHPLQVRDRLGGMAAEYRSHRLDDAEEVFEVQMSVEIQIRDEFPTAFDERFAEWVQQDRAAEHPDGVMIFTDDQVDGIITILDDVRQRALQDVTVA
jgi:hypothetical protein